GRPGEKLSGSHALRDAVRSLVLVAADEETQRTILTIDKYSYGPRVGESWAVSLIDTDVLTSEGELVSVARIVHLGDSDVSVGDLINRGESNDVESDERNAADRFIYEYLAEEGGSANARDVIKAGVIAGFSESTLTKRR